MSILAENLGCCAEVRVFLERWDPRSVGDTVRYVLAARVMKVAVVPPSEWLAEPRRFRVEEGPAPIRTTPDVPAEPTEPSDPYYPQGPGHLLGEYGPGARGLVLAERRDDAGAVWWFVLMSGRTPPLSTPYRAYPHDTRAREVVDTVFPTDRVGWMRAGG
jgi:hypothetical protein